MAAKVQASALRDPVVTVGTMPTGVAVSGTTAYVANEGSDDVSVIDLTQSPPVVSATISVGKAPDAVALSADGSRLDVSNFGGDSVSIISTATDAVSHTVTVGSRPAGLLEVGGSLYVANLLSGTISVIDPTSGTVTGTISLPGAGTSSGAAPSGLAASSDGHTLYVDDARNGTTYVIDLTQSPPAVTGSVADGSFPAYLSVAGSTAYVASPGSNSISVLDLSPSPPTLSSTVTVGTRPYGVVALPPLGEVFATDSGSNNVSVVDTSVQPAAAVSTTATGTTPDAIAVSPDQTTAVISDEASDSVSIFHVNQAPVNTVPGAQTVDANDSSSVANKLTFSSANSNLISTSDSDAGSNPVLITLSVSDGTLTLSGTSGLSFSSGSSGSASMTFTGSLTDVNSALAGMTYEPATGFHGTDTLSLTDDDQGNTGLGKPQSATSTVSIGVVNVAPVAGSPSFSGAIGNTTFGVGTSPASPSTSTSGTVLEDSTDANGDTLTAVPGTITTANGGSVSMNSAGTFTYQPPVGFTGNDTFTFQVSDGFTTSSGTATIAVANRVWYVNDNDGTNGNGTSTSPFNTLASVHGASGSGDYIFLYGSSTSYGGGIVLKASQTLVGQSFGLSIGGQTVVSASGSNPTITNAGGAGITLGEGDTVDGITVSGTSGIGIAASGINSFTLDSSDSISNTTGNGLDINGGNGTISDGATINASAAHSISIQNRSGGTITNSGAITDDGTGILVSSNTGATVDFTGKITASTATHTAFTATGGGTVAATGSGSTLTTTTATALNVSSTTIGSSGLDFQSVSSNGANPGINLSNTGSSGGLTVTGSGTTAGSGGTIQSSAGEGITLSSTSSPSFTDMVIKNNAADGITGSQVNGLTLAGSTLSGNGTYANISGYNQDGLDFTGGLTGTVTISNSTVTNSADSGLQVTDSSGNLNLTITGSTFSDGGPSVPGASDPLLGDGVAVLPDGSTSATVSVTSSTFTTNTGYHFAFQPASFGATSGTNSVTFNNNTLSNSTGLGNGGGVEIAGDGTSTTTLDVKGNSITGAARAGIALYNDGTTTLSGTVSGNTVGNPAVACSGSVQGSDIAPTTRGSATSTLAITNNNLYQYNNWAGIATVNDEGSGVMNLTITGNTIADPVPGTETCPTAGGPEGALWGLVLTSGAQTGDTNTTCANISGNSMAGSSPSAADGGIDDFELDEWGNGIYRLPGYLGDSADSNAVVSYIQGRNTGNGTPSGDTFINGTGQSGGYFFNTTSCPTPST